MLHVDSSCDLIYFLYASKNLHWQDTAHDYGYEADDTSATM